MLDVCSLLNIRLRGQKARQILQVALFTSSKKKKKGTGPCGEVIWLRFLERKEVQRRFVRPLDKVIKMS